jgi:Protein of unknown function (DUF2281)
MDNATLYSKLVALPDHIKSEVSDFIDFLLSKKKETKNGKKAKFGSAKGMFIMKPGFDDPLEDFKEYTH